MNFLKLTTKHNLIYLFFSFLPISFIIGKAILELNIILIIIFFISDLIYEKQDLKKIFRSRIFLSLTILWIYLNFNIFNGLDNKGNIIRGLFFFKYILLIFAFIHYLKLVSLRDKIINFWTIVLLIVSFDVWYEFFVGKNILGFESPMINERIVSFFKDELIVGSYLATFLFIIFGKFYSKNNLVLSLILFLIFSISIFMTGERSITLKIFFSFLLIFFFVFKETKLKILIFSFLLFLIFIVVANKNLNNRYNNTFYELNENIKIGSFYESTINIKYLNQIIFSYEILKQNYLFGVGTKNYFKACINLKNTSKNEFVKKNTDKCFIHPHQFHYEFISEHGLIGTIIIISCIFILFSNRRNIELSDQKKRQLFIFKIYILISLLPIIPTGSFFSSLNLFQFFLNYSFYKIYFLEK
jgi:O-antigen ligase